jgi:hypothetical protein
MDIMTAYPFSRKASTTTTYLSLTPGTPEHAQFCLMTSPETEASAKTPGTGGGAGGASYTSRLLPAVATTAWGGNLINLRQNSSTPANPQFPMHLISPNTAMGPLRNMGCTEIKEEQEHNRCEISSPLSNQGKQEALKCDNINDNLLDTVDTNCYTYHSVMKEQVVNNVPSDGSATAHSISSGGHFHKLGVMML